MSRVALLATVLALGWVARAGEAPPPDDPGYGYVEVRLPDRAALDEWTARGLVITNVRDGTLATFYVTPAQRRRLESAGYAVTPAPRPDRETKAFDGYHDYRAVTARMRAFESAHPDLCRVYTLGQSVQGRELWAALITESVGFRHDRPSVRFVSTMHGDEPLGTEMCLYFIEVLLEGYGTDPRLTWLVDETAIWVVPLMNPDGLEALRRTNARFRDLNRDFPVYPEEYTGSFYVGEPLWDAGRQPETAAIMRWAVDEPFVLAANFHTGELVVNYPYDDDGKGSVHSPTPDENLFRFISLEYSRNNPHMWYDSPFQNGITNGAAWYAIPGGLQDWSYRYTGCLEVTIEISRTKAPPPEAIPLFWEDNRDAMLAYLETAHIGARGIVTRRDTGEPLLARVRVEGNEQPVFTDPDVGNYHRMLMPGAYTLRFDSRGHAPVTVRDVLVDGAMPATRVDVSLVNVDVTGDGEATLQDVLRVVDAALGRSAECDCDFDGSGSIGAADIQYVVNGVLSTP